MMIKINGSLKNVNLLDILAVIAVMPESDPKKAILRTEVRRREQNALAMWDKN